MSIATRIRDLLTRLMSSAGRDRLSAQRGCSLRCEHLEDRRVLSATGGVLEPGALVHSYDQAAFATDRILVAFEGEVGATMQSAGTAAALNQATSLVAGKGLTDPEVLYELGASDVRDARLGTLWHLPDGLSVVEAIASVSNLPGVAYAEPDYVQFAGSTETEQLVPGDPMFTDLWGLNNTGQTGGTADADIDAVEAWDIATGSSDVVVAVIDTGIDWNHPDLVENMWSNPGEIVDGLDNDGNGFVDDIVGWDFFGNDNDPFDSAANDDHGTHVAGTIGGVGDNDEGVTGVNWDIQIMSLKFLGPLGGSTSDAIAALNYATMMRRDFGINIVLTSNSWGGGGFSQGLEDAIAASGEENMLFVAAAGNDGVNTDGLPHFPSSYDLDNIISVAATDHNDALAGFSNFGAASVDLGAPGVSIVSTTPNNTYSSFNGTSMATPHVSGVAALLWSEDPTASYQEIRNAIFAGADPIPSLSGNTVTGGRLNALGALNVLNSPGPVVVQSSPTGESADPVSSVEFVFNETMDTTSFAVADDVVLFNGPAETPAADLSGEITGFTWLTDQRLRIEFNTQSEAGDYTLVIGPQILAADDGAAMNQDFDATPGEAAEDVYAANFSIAEIFDYQATSAPLAAVDLVPGAPGVFVVLDGVDDGTASVNLGSETFNFYGETYSGAGELWASSNGLVTFGSGSSAYINTDLTTSPTQAAIAPLWDDLRTDQNSLDQVLGQFVDTGGDSTPEWLYLEWNEVQTFSSSPSTITFQVGLELNTGATPGEIMFNYPDIDTGSASAEGASATVGIKAAGLQGANRLLVSFNDASTLLVGTGQAVLLSTTEDESLVLAPPTPGEVSTINTLEVTGATPGETVYFVFGTEHGSTPIPPAPSLILDIGDPRLIGSVVADVDGIARLDLFVPAVAAGQTGLFQAAQLVSGHVSNLVEFTLPLSLGASSLAVSSLGASSLTGSGESETLATKTVVQSDVSAGLDTQVGSNDAQTIVGARASYEAAALLERIDRIFDAYAHDRVEPAHAFRRFLSSSSLVGAHFVNLAAELNDVLDMSWQPWRSREEFHAGVDRLMASLDDHFDPFCDLGYRFRHHLARRS